MGDPIQRPKNRRRHKTRIAGPQAALGHALLDQIAQLEINLRLAGAQGLAAFSREAVFTYHCNCRPQIGRDPGAIPPDQQVNTLHHRQSDILTLRHGVAQNLQPLLMAAKENVLFALHIVIDGPFGDVQGCCDILKRGLLIAMIVEQPRSGLKHRLALGFPLGIATRPRFGPALVTHAAALPSNLRHPAPKLTR